jgi:hypothetical protein
MRLKNFGNNQKKENDLIDVLVDDHVKKIEVSKKNQ